MGRSLPDLLASAAERRPSHVAVEDFPDGRATYAGLDALSDRVRNRLRALGVARGDRVGVYLGKSIDAYAAMLGAMKAGAAYVPVDADLPPARAAYITSHCRVAALVVHRDLVPAWRQHAEAVGGLPPLVELESAGGGRGLADALDRADAVSRAPAAETEPLDAEDLAYILYTSGSTGEPKGVMLTHACALSHVDWCIETLGSNEHDRFSSHAPFHFDLSITDLYVPLRLAATVVLIDSARGKDPAGLAALIADRRLTVWYSTPSVLKALLEFGKMERHDYSPLRSVYFAGEVFPVKYLRAVKSRLPGARFYNLYGPTETNVCTWQPIPSAIEDDRVVPYPIGRMCAHFRGRVVDDRGDDVPDGTKGELVVHGSGMLTGYWNDPVRTTAAFLIDAAGRRWYRTGDVVVRRAGGVHEFIGRRDRMVKRRGYRIELGDIEAALHRHPAVTEAATVVRVNADGDVGIVAFLATGSGQRLSQIEIRKFCSETIPGYMIPDRFDFVDELPKTSTDKIDYQRLKQAV
jgi:amino acid adenylation domain-containing protein